MGIYTNIATLSQDKKCALNVKAPYLATFRVFGKDLYETNTSAG
jgi:hypothetical protein